VLIEADSTALIGEFDAVVISDALKSISLSAMKLLGVKRRDEPLQVAVKLHAAPQPAGVIEWKGFQDFDHDPFRSFVGADEIRLSLAARAIEAHNGAAERMDGVLRVTLPLAR
jgi:hypothetical protein